MEELSAETDLIDPTAYRFQIALIDAIEIHVKSLRRQGLGALRYRGADLGRAIAIELYFRLVNDAELKRAFDRYIAGESIPDDPDQIPVSTIANWVFAHMCHRYRNPLMTLTGLKRYARGVIQAARANSSIVAVRPPRPSKEGETVAFLALSKRFYSYLYPIKQRLDRPAVWLVPDGEEWVNELESAGEEVIRFGSNTGDEPAVQKFGPLANWRAHLQRYDFFLDLLYRIRPISVVVAEGNNVADELLARAAEVADVPSICVQQGWSPVVHNGFRNMCFDAFCVWGEEFAAMLRPVNRRQVFRVTGSHMIAPLKQKADPSANAISFFLQKDSLLISEAAWEGMLEFVRWCAATWPKRYILVREHPAGPLNDSELQRLRGYSNIRFCPARDMPLEQILDSSELMVAFFSTTLIEGIARHVTPLIINITGTEHYFPDLAATGVAVEVKSFEQARKMIAILLADNGGADQRAYMHEVISRFFADDRAAALDNIVHLAKSPGSITGRLSHWR